MDTQTILIVDDDAEIREGIRILLTGENYNILEAGDGHQALKLLTPSVDLVILDIMMPSVSGLLVCQKIRKNSAVPILFLTAKAQESDMLLGLLAGGDDYLTKPFSYSELIGRVKALLRRYCVYQGKKQNAPPEEEPLTSHDICLSRESNQVWLRGQEIDLTHTEYRILRLLMEQPLKIFSIQNIYESIWNEPYYHISKGTVMVHIRKLRVKIEDDPGDPKRVKTIWGKGYRFEGESNEA